MLVGEGIEWGWDGMGWDGGGRVTVRRPRLIVPTNLQRAIEVDIVGGVL